MTERIIRLRTDGLDWRAVEDELIVLDRGAGRYLAMNRTATLLWPALERGASAGELVDAVAGRWPGAADRAAEDVARFVAWLDERQMLA